jgi:7,8-dihydroneopterin aldolase/epimerase/oxygenase
VRAPGLIHCGMTLDRVWLMGVECRCRVGVPSAERRRPQKIRIDLGLEVDAARAAARDDFREAADYSAVEKAVRASAEAGERALIETLAEAAAAAALQAAPAAAAVTVRVHKTPAVMPKTRGVFVEIRRERPGRG